MSAETDKIQDVLSSAALGFGVVATASPGLFLKLYGLQGDDTARMFVRMWGVANTSIGVDGLRAVTPDERREGLVRTAALSVGNSAAILVAGKGVGGGSRALGLLTTLGFAAAALYALNEE